MFFYIYPSCDLKLIKWSYHSDHIANVQVFVQELIGQEQ